MHLHEVLASARKSKIYAYLMNTKPKSASERLTLMSDKYPMSLRRRTESRQVANFQSLRKIHGKIVVAIERALQPMFNRDGSLIPIPVRKSGADGDRCRSRDRFSQS
jgi:hypothetical protein